MLFEGGGQRLVERRKCQSTRELDGAVGHREQEPAFQTGLGAQDLGAGGVVTMAQRVAVAGPGTGLRGFGNIIVRPKM